MSAWEAIKNKNLDKDLKEVEGETVELSERNEVGVFTKEEKPRLRNLEDKKKK
jgi:hypothetical protein